MQLFPLSCSSNNMLLSVSICTYFSCFLQIRTIVILAFVVVDTLLYFFQFFSRFVLPTVVINPFAP